MLLAAPVSAQTDWSWYGGNVIDFLPVGGLVFRAVVGCPDYWIHWHLP